MIIYDNENTLNDIVEKIDNFEVFVDGEIRKVEHQNSEFIVLKNKLFDLFSNSRLMPAFGVSLHNETLNELKIGEWLKINFSKLITKNGLSFDSLLIKLEKTRGCNLIRLFNGKYEGRCLYVDFDETVNLADLIK